MTQRSKTSHTNKRSRTFMFTWNNYNDDSLTRLKTLATETEYMIVGAETGEQGTPHYQGYCRFRSQRTLKSVIKKMMIKGVKKEDGTNNSANVEIANGGDDANTVYCSKDGDVVLRHGTPAAPGKRNDLTAVRELIENGGNMEDVIRSNTSYQGLRAAPTYLTYLEQKRDFVPTVVWLYGETGSGKTRAAREWLPDAWMSGISLRWWDEYDGQADVIIDDFRGDFCTFHYLLRILDRYPMKVEVKGGHRQLLARRIVITSPYSPQRAYKKCEENMAQLLRRITLVKKMTMGDSLDISAELENDSQDKMTQNDSMEIIDDNEESSSVERATRHLGEIDSEVGSNNSKNANPYHYVLPGWNPKECGLTDIEWLMDKKEQDDRLDERDWATYNRLITWARGNGFKDEEIRAKTIGGWELMLLWAKSFGFEPL